MEATSIAKLYQIRLFKKGEIEVFQNVSHHKVRVLNGRTASIKIQYTGATEETERSMEGIYDVRVIEAPQYEPSGSYPENAKIIIH